MLGHEPIIAMRQHGTKPGLVQLDLDRDHGPAKAWREWPGLTPLVATVWVQPADSPQRLDLRFLVGLQAIVTGSDAARVHAVADACLAHGAKRVIRAVMGPREAARQTDGIGVVEFADSASQEVAHG